MITKLFNQPHMLTQEFDDDLGIMEAAIAASVDNAGQIVLEQEGRHICINRKSVPDLIKLLRMLAKGDQA